MLKILVLTSTFPRWKNDTTPSFVYQLSKRLAQKNEVHILAPSAPNALSKDRWDNLTIIRFKYFFNNLQSLAYNGGISENIKKSPANILLIPFFLISQLIALIRILRKNEFDIVHAHWVIPQGLIAIIALAFLKKQPKLICTSHGADLFSFNNIIANSIKKYVLKHSDKMTFVSKALEEKARQYTTDIPNSSIIPMGVDLLNKFIPSNDARIPNKILFVGRLVEKKGVKYLIKSLPTLLIKHPNITLDIIGTGPNIIKLKQLVTQLNLNSTVEFLGAIENNKLPEYYQKSSIAVFPSIIARNGDQEGFGLVPVEASGCECPIIATNLPALKEHLIHLKTAYIVKQKSSESISNAIEMLLTNKDLTKSIVETARAHMLLNYDWSTITDNYQEQYESLVQVTTKNSN